MRAWDVSDRSCSSSSRVELRSVERSIWGISVVVAIVALFDEADVDDSLGKLSCSLERSQVLHDLVHHLSLREVAELLVCLLELKLSLLALDVQDVKCRSLTNADRVRTGS